MESYNITNRSTLLQKTWLFDSRASIVDKFRVNFPNENFARNVHGHATKFQYIHAHSQEQGWAPWRLGAYQRVTVESLYMWGHDLWLGRHV